MAIYTSGFICQDLIEEGAEHVFTAIRIVDRIEVDVPTDLPPGAIVVTTPISFYAVMSFRSDGPEDFDMVFTGIAPGEIRANSTTSKVHTDGGVRGHSFAMRLHFDPRNLGLWWFEVKINDAVAFKMPLELAAQKGLIVQPEKQSPEQRSLP